MVKRIVIGKTIRLFVDAFELIDFSGPFDLFGYVYAMAADSNDFQMLGSDI